MRKLSNGEIFSKVYKGDTNIEAAKVQQLSQDIGVIAPEHIEGALVNLKTHSKNAYFAFLSEALSLYEQRGLIRLFNLTDKNNSRSRIPTAMPYFPLLGRNRFSSTERDKVIFVNMYRVGHWSADETTYEGCAALTDLYSCLESGVIGRKLLIEGKEDAVFDNKSVLEYFTNIYTFLFSQAMQKCKTTYGGSDFQNDAANFLISKFCLRYVLDKPDSDYTDDMAYLAVRNRSSLESLKSFEDINKIDYSSLSMFLKTFGEAFYNGQGVELVNFENKWVSLYGDATGLAIEYAPYMLHFLFAAMHGAILGGGIRLGRQLDNLRKLGLPKLYNSVVNALK